MAWNLRKRIKIAKGVHLNLSKRGVSTSIGPKGANVTIGKNGTYLNSSIPGTGIYSRKKITSSKTNNKEDYLKQRFSSSNKKEGFLDFRNTRGCVFRWLSIVIIIFFLFHLIAGNIDLKFALLVFGIIAGIYLFLYYKSIMSFLCFHCFPKKTLEKMISKEDNENRKIFLYGLATLYSKEINNGDICIDSNLNDGQRVSFKKLCVAFEKLCTCDRIWLVSSKMNNYENKSSAYYSIDRKSVKFSKQCFNNVIPKDTLFVPTLNDGIINYYIYPQYVVIAKGKTDFEILSLEEFSIIFDYYNIIEDNFSKYQMPNDSQIIRYTYQKINKDGSPDLRFKDNKKLPVFKYGSLFIEPLGLTFLVSNVDKAKAFSDAYTDHKAVMKL